MTTITRETLELAALAAGMKADKSIRNGGPSGNDGFDMAGAMVIDWHNGIVWRPHLDIADAARLAAHLRFCVRVDHAAAEVVDVDGNIVALVPHNDTDADAERAYCEAVTLGAAHEGRWIRDNRAEIGRRMREGGR